VQPISGGVRKGLRQCLRHPHTLAKRHRIPEERDARTCWRRDHLAVAVLVDCIVNIVDDAPKGINLTDRRAAASRRMQLEVLQSLDPDGIARRLRGMKAWDQAPAQSTEDGTTLAAAPDHAGASRRPSQRSVRAPESAGP
jgi:hypothetical protein